MADTPNIRLSFLEANQAQKHVTVNEALAILDAVAQLRVVSATMQSPPASAVDGEAYLVPSGAGGDWSTRSRQVAIWSNGGWLYLNPKVGWCAWDAQISGRRLFDGVDWIPDAFVASPGGASSSWSLVEFDHVFTAGVSNSTAFVIPSLSQVHAVTGRVVQSLTGSGLIGWSVGVAGAGDRYGSGIGTARNSYFVGVSGAPVTYYQDTPLQLRADAGSVASGVVRVAITLTQFRPPRLVPAA